MSGGLRWVVAVAVVLGACIGWQGRGMVRDRELERVLTAARHYAAMANIHFGNEDLLRGVK